MRGNINHARLSLHVQHLENGRERESIEVTGGAFVQACCALEGAGAPEICGKVLTDQRCDWSGLLFRRVRCKIVEREGLWFVVDALIGRACAALRGQLGSEV